MGSFSAPDALQHAVLSRWSGVFLRIDRPRTGSASFHAAQHPGMRALEGAVR
jgi:hypothetical protein